MLFIQSLWLGTLEYTPGWPASPQPAPQETTPYWIPLATRGPPDELIKYCIRGFKIQPIDNYELWNVSQMK